MRIKLSNLVLTDIEAFIFRGQIICPVCSGSGFRRCRDVKETTRIIDSDGQTTGTIDKYPDCEGGHVLTNSKREKHLRCQGTGMVECQFCVQKENDGPRLYKGNSVKILFADSKNCLSEKTRFIALAVLDNGGNQIVLLPAGIRKPQSSQFSEYLPLENLLDSDFETLRREIAKIEKQKI